MVGRYAGCPTILWAGELVRPETHGQRYFDLAERGRQNAARSTRREPPLALAGCRSFADVARLALGRRDPLEELAAAVFAPQPTRRIARMNRMGIGGAAFTR